MNIATKFDIGEAVHVDGCKSIVAYVTSIEIRPQLRYEVSWFDNAKCEFMLFDEWRLTKAVT